VGKEGANRPSRGTASPRSAQGRRQGDEHQPPVPAARLSASLLPSEIVRPKTVQVIKTDWVVVARPVPRFLRGHDSRAVSATSGSTTWSACGPHLHCGLPPGGEVRAPSLLRYLASSTTGCRRRRLLQRSQIYLLASRPCGANPCRRRRWRHRRRES
jgi:hypothetical protein